jgi:hypothetical protein
MRRWGYITIEGTARKIHKGPPGPDAVLRATAQGLRARQIWLPLPGLIEQRWRERFGTDQAGQLRDALIAVVRELDPGLPDCLPILGAALLSQAPDAALPPRPDGAVLGANGTRRRDLPALTGTAKEAVSWATGILIRAHLAAEEPDPAAGRGRVARLTLGGLDAQRRHHELAAAPDGVPSPLFEGLEPYPDNWRASVRRPATMPHYPMVLHRGGYPDGS